MGRRIGVALRSFPFDMLSVRRLATETDRKRAVALLLAFAFLSHFTIPTLHHCEVLNPGSTQPRPDPHAHCHHHQNHSGSPPVSEGGSAPKPAHDHNSCPLCQGFLILAAGQQAPDAPFRLSIDLEKQHATRAPETARPPSIFALIHRARGPPA